MRDRQGIDTRLFSGEQMEAELRKLVMGCTVAALTALSAPSGGTPAQIRLRPLPANIQVGVASWYGAEFQGYPTASGPPFDMNAMTCAHRCLPLGTRIEVTDLLTFRSLVLRVNDRGPYVAGRVLDVSRAAAKRLGFLGAGLAPVRIEILSYPHHCMISHSSPVAVASSAN